MKRVCKLTLGTLGLLFLGIGIIQSGAAGFDPHGDLVQLLGIAGHNPIRMAFFAAILGWLVFQGGRRLSVQRFFGVTSVVITFICTMPPGVARLTSVMSRVSSSNPASTP